MIGVGEAKVNSVEGGDSFFLFFFGVDINITSFSSEGIRSYENWFRL